MSICPEIRDALAMSSLQEDASALQALSPREFEILCMLLDAKSAEEIATAFNLSLKTVSNYHYEIKMKLGVASDIELVHFGLRTGAGRSVAGARRRDGTKILDPCTFHRLFQSNVCIGSECDLGAKLSRCRLDPNRRTLAQVSCYPFANVRNLFRGPQPLFSCLQSYYYLKGH